MEETRENFNINRNDWIDEKDEYKGVCNNFQKITLLGQIEFDMDRRYWKKSLRNAFKRHKIKENGNDWEMSMYNSGRQRLNDDDDDDNTVRKNGSCVHNQEDYYNRTLNIKNEMYIGFVSMEIRYK